MSLEFKVFTLNCWAIPIPTLSKNRKRRLKAIAEHISNSHYDVVCLQEIWSDQDYYSIKDEVAGVLPYSHYFYSGVTGSGVCIYSKHVIEDTFFHQYSLNGYIHKLQHGDWFGGKGIGLCKLSVSGFSVNIYSAHLHAEYNRNNDEYEAHRILQAYDVAQFIKLTSQGVDLTVLAGDLNTLPGDIAYRLILIIPGLVDSFEYANVPKDHIATCESLRNTYTPSSYVKQKIPGQRIDFIMYHPGSKLQVEMRNYRLPLPDRVPQCTFSYSDHEAVEVTLEISKKAAMTYCRNEHDLQNILHESILILDRGLASIYTHKILYSVLGIILFCSLIVTFTFDVPIGFIVLYNILKVLIGLGWAFCLLMATVWNKIERHGVLAGKSAIEKHLKKPTS
ncbi:putative neutral sphingomyelinase [Diabrotica virgifera virgifera]|uniref:sphingomyelin phosphodiesterase n=2 Tax=Diabrotica virgifera virgifera TaxID=50390 RepID=A0A6P7FWE8_DIAVI|nr:putative neutral sphingomyelinase [Diabrotica virgifera virgifera]